MRTQLVRTATVTATLTASLALAACGSNSLDQPDAEPAAALPKVTLDAAAAKLVPAEIKAKGTLSVGTDASYAPNEFMSTDGKTPQGMDIDLIKAIASKLGISVDPTNGDFDALILGVSSGKYDVGISSFTINSERLREVTMISYFNAGSSWAVAKGNPNNFDPTSPCGQQVGIQRGTTQVDMVEGANKKCLAEGKPAIKTVIETEQSKVTASLIAGKVKAMIADSPITSYAIAQNKDELEQVGGIEDAADYGIVLPKSQTAFAKAIAAALESLKKDGTYNAIINKWGNSAGAIDSFVVNPS